MIKHDLLELADNTKGKRDKTFLELLYNNNFRLETENLHIINSAYKFKDKLGLSIIRQDFSNTHIIKM